MNERNQEKEFQVPIVNNRSFQFTPETLLKRKKKKKEEITASIDTKYGRISFGVDAIRFLQLDRCKIKFYVDTGSKVISFKQKCEFSSLEEMKNWRKVTKCKGGIAICSVEAVVNELRNNYPNLLRSYKKLPIKKWIPKDMLSEEFYYLDLRAYERDRQTSNGANA